MGRRNYGTNMDGLAAAVAEAEASVGGDGGGRIGSGVAVAGWAQGSGVPGWGRLGLSRLEESPHQHLEGS